MLTTAQHYADVRFEQATLDAWSALHNFWIVHKALMRTLGVKYLNGPIAGLKVQQRYCINTTVFGVVTRAGATVTVKCGRRSFVMSYAEFKRDWWIL
jgi:hypothetical protein